MNRIIQAVRVVCSRHSSVTARAEPESRIQKEKKLGFPSGPLRNRERLKREGSCSGRAFPSLSLPVDGCAQCETRGKGLTQRGRARMIGTRCLSRHWFE